MENAVNSTLDIAPDVSHSFKADELHFGGWGWRLEKGEVEEMVCAC